MTRTVLPRTKTARALDQSIREQERNRPADGDHDAVAAARPAPAAQRTLSLFLDDDVMLSCLMMT
eukprot:6380172-Prymnesium_polylepis.1